MGRSKTIARSIARAITDTTGLAKRRSSNSNPLRLILSLFSVFFSIHQLILQKIRPADFANLRRNHWDVEDDDYYQSFQPQDGDKPEESLTSIGDMGFSGSVSLPSPHPAIRTSTNNPPTTDLLLNQRPKVPRQIRPTALRTLLLP